MTSPNPSVLLAESVLSPDFERRFGGLRRLYGQDGAQAIFNAHVVVVGVGGVGSWAAEALARSGIGALTLIDLDHVAESNINRQVQALGSTVGMSKVQALAQRLLDIHPTCDLRLVEDFLTPENLSTLLPDERQRAQRHLAVIDACDQVRTKAALTAWCACQHVQLTTVGAAGGKRHAQRVETGDLAQVTHDPLLAQLRYRLRKFHEGARQGSMGVACVYSRESVFPPSVSCAASVGEGDAPSDGSLNCHGYGSVVTVTATFGMVAAGCAIDQLTKAKSVRRPPGVAFEPLIQAII